MADLGVGLVVDLGDAGELAGVGPEAHHEAVSAVALLHLKGTRLGHHHRHLPPVCTHETPSARAHNKTRFFLGGAVLNAKTSVSQHRRRLATFTECPAAPAVLFSLQKCMPRMGRAPAP